MQEGRRQGHQSFPEHRGPGRAGSEGRRRAASCASCWWRPSSKGNRAGPGPSLSPQSFLRAGEAPTCPGWRRPRRPGADPHVGPGNRARREAARAPRLPARRRLGSERRGPSRGWGPARPKTSPPRPPLLGPRGWGPGRGSAAAASPASPEAPPRPFLPGRGPKPRNPAREGAGRTKRTTLSRPRLQSSKSVALLARGCRLPQCLAGVGARLGLLTVSRLLRISRWLCRGVAAPSPWRERPCLHPKITHR